jgi:hypothetical protein
MKHLEHLTDLFSIGFGMFGAFSKGLKNKLPRRSILISICIAGVLSYGTIGIIALFYDQLTPKLTILASFCVGWVANELTSKLDEFVNDFYDIFIDKIKSIFTKKSNQK